MSVAINASSDEIFSDDVANNIDVFLAEEVSKDSLARYVFMESVRKHKIAKASGVRSVKHCPIAIRLGALVRGKMGYSGGLYDLVASALGLPTSRTLREYTIPTSNDPDRMLFANILRAADEFNKLNPRAGLYDWRRHCSLGFDSMTCKGSFVVNYHTNDVIGLGADCLKPNVILNELKELESREKSNSQLERESTTKDEKFVIPEPARHFLIFVVTSWSPTSLNGSRSRHQFVCARYGLSTIDSDF